MPPLLFQLLYELWDCLVQVRNVSQICDLVDRGIRVLTGRREMTKETCDYENHTLLMATIIFESFIPAKCWIAPLIPTAM